MTTARAKSRQKVTPFWARAACSATAIARSLPPFGRLIMYNGRHSCERLLAESRLAWRAWRGCARWLHHCCWLGGLGAMLGMALPRLRVRTLTPFSGQRVASCTRAQSASYRIEDQRRILPHTVLDSSDGRMYSLGYSSGRRARTLHLHVQQNVITLRHASSRDHVSHGRRPPSWQFANAFCFVAGGCAVAWHVRYFTVPRGSMHSVRAIAYPTRPCTLCKECHPPSLPPKKLSSVASQPRIFCLCIFECGPHDAQMQTNGGNQAVIE